MEHEDMYGGMTKPKSLNELVADDVGIGFSLGAVGGFAYHLVKGLERHSYGAALRLACQKAPRVGGTGALFGAATNTMIILGYLIRDKSDLCSIFFSYGFGGAAVNIKRGFLSASRSGLCFGTGATICFAWLDYMRFKEEKEAVVAQFHTLSHH